MLILLLILLMFLPGAVLPLLLETRVSPDELIEMGVDTEDIQSKISPREDQIISSQSGSLRLCVGLCA